MASGKGDSGWQREAAAVAVTRKTGVRRIKAGLPEFRE